MSPTQTLATRPKTPNLKTSPVHSPARGPAAQPHQPNPVRPFSFSWPSSGPHPHPSSSASVLPHRSVQPRFSPPAHPASESSAHARAVSDKPGPPVSAFFFLCRRLCFARRSLPFARSRLPRAPPVGPQSPFRPMPQPHRIHASTARTPPSRSQPGIR